MLELHDICRSFSGRQVLHDVSLTAERGQLTGFVGGNGAGKTTTMRIILGVLAPDSGQMQLDGVELGSQARSRFGYMPSERGLYPKMKVAEQITYLARLHGYSKPEATHRAVDLLSQLGLSGRLKDPLEALSLGNQQRVQIAASLVHEPDVLILDEPFSGLDPFAVDLVLKVLSDKAASGAVVLFSSHQLDVVERLCDDLVIIGDGKVLAAGGREDLRRRHGTLRYEIASEADLSWVQSRTGIRTDESHENRVVFRAEESAAQELLRDALQRGPVTSFVPVLPTLSEIFREFTNDSAPTVPQEASR
ncbi:ABC transporter ATP-binding protein [Nesterenkonia haasae]|uniref:ABC transporter ATP-binding protein n=1 Tax=Nesterenkonia haasae TaxID=2587813 RepID=UPI0013913B5E|nr:ATP-binding cassette domain-containing protein [Nesterenkonia haasae]NDK32713.1 ATP-binding cassette domain-containing protein [Nesterenkonia haasae]